MDVLKYPVEKLIYFLATLLPGFAALLIFEASHAGCFDWFFVIPFIGYRTKLAVAMFVAFVVGYSVTALLGYTLAALGGMLGAVMPYVPPSSFAAAPWRDPKWRYALKRYLGPDAPEDTMLITPEGYSWREAFINASSPENQRQAQIAQLQADQFTSQSNDSRWADWYDQIDRTLREQMQVEWMTLVREGLDINF